MKKLTVLLFAIVLGSSQVFALDNNTPMNTESQLRNEVAALLKSPEIKVERGEITADIEFTLNNNGEIVVLTVDSDKDPVINYIKSRLNYKKVRTENTNNKNRVFHLTLRIKKPQNA